MDFDFSSVVDRPLYETHGLANSISLRVHNEPIHETIGSLRAQRDWTKHNTAISGYKGGLGPRYGFMSVTVPECLPERLEILSYLNEYAFLYDDEMEQKATNEDPEEMFRMMRAILKGGAVKKSLPTDAKKRLQCKIFAELAAIDPLRAVTMMECWAIFVKSATQTRDTQYQILEEYIPARVIDCGECYWFGTLTFGMALTIPEDERAVCMELGKPAYGALALTNDLYSWEKERKESHDAGQEYVFNAVWVIMKERSVGEEEAKSACREEIQKLISLYCGIVDEVMKNSALSRDSRIYLQALLFSYVGNLVWSIECPRYRQ